MSDPLSQYELLIGKLHAVAMTTGCGTDLGDALHQLIALSIQQGTPYGLDLVDLARWIQEQLVRAAIGADLVVVSA